MRNGQIPCPKRSDGPAARPRRPARGFTLIELLVAVAMIAILAAVGFPSFDGVMLRSAVRSASTDFGADLNFARAEAIRVSGRVTICPRSAPTAQTCGSDWKTGWLVFRDVGTTGIGSFGSADRLLREHGPIDSRLTLTRTVGTGALTFMASGSLQPSGTVSAARFTLRSPGVQGRDLDVSVIGRLVTRVEPL